MKEKLENLWEEVRELSLGGITTANKIDRLQTPPTPLQFLRDYLSPNKPFILSASAASTLRWPALTSWSSDAYLLRRLSSSTVSVHLTPTGAADSLTPHPSDPNKTSLCFASAHVQPTPFPLALAAIRGSNRSFVAYAQQQNDCFRSEYSPLAGDCESHIPFASEALGCLPETVNLWIGNEFSQTSFHKDHYENLYAVITGEKHFLLLPPTDVHRMYIREYPAAQYSYSQDTEEFTLELESPVRYVPWCSVDPFPKPGFREEQIAKFPLYYNGPKPFKCTVKAGEILYLPSMWFHHVRQTPDRRGLTIAVNYWYDMQFDIKYAYFNFLQSLSSTICDRTLDEPGCHMPCAQSSMSYLDEESSVIKSVENGDTENGSEKHDEE